MKKLFAVLVVCLLFFTACGDEPTNGPDLSGSNMDLVPANVQKLMTSGDQLISDTVESYTGITDANYRELIKGLADYTLFPVDFESDASLQDRLKAYLGGEDNLINASKIQDDIINGRVPGSSIDNRIPRSVRPRGFFKKLGKFLKAVAPIADCLFPGAGKICSGVGKQLDKKKREPSMEAKINTQLSQIGKTLDTFMAENRVQFGALNTKLDSVLGQLGSVAGDISLIKTALSGITAILVNTGMDNVKFRFDAFCQNIAESATTTDASNTTYFYFVQSSAFNEDLNKFFTDAAAIQSWAIDNTNISGYTAWLENDPSLSTNYFPMLAQVKKLVSTDWNSCDDFFIFDFHNPKRYLSMSMGNLDYFAKMVLTRLEMNEIVYSGSVLSTHNATLAQSFLNRIEASEIKNSISEAIQVLMEDYKSYNNYYFGYGIFDSIFDEWTSRSCRIISLDGVYQEYNSLGLDRRPDGPANLYAKSKIPVHFQAAQNEYLTHFIARLVALETILKSYL